MQIQDYGQTTIRAVASPSKHGTTEGSVWFEKLVLSAADNEEGTEPTYLLYFD
jgi:hypothetical protein